ncbi:hypothetical protein [Streptomyces sp. NPDC003077]|uniref:hypothetical protein n=1 Tax=Streptomyces sp. NPDC003077 TaxID=3154443 RepID=UPI0033B6D3A1
MGAPYDRLIATCAVPRIPAEWLEQVKPGDGFSPPSAVGCTPPSWHARLTVREDGTAAGRFLDVGTASWAALCRHGDRWIVEEGGPVPLWERVEDHLLRRREDGSPGSDRFPDHCVPVKQTITWAV